MLRTAITAALLGGLAATITVAPAGAQGLAGIWRPGGGTQWWRSDMTSDQFKKQDKIHFDNGLRITSLAIRGGRIAALWQPGTGTQWVHWDMTGDEFKAKDTAYFRQGLRITAFEIDAGRIAAVWRPGTGTQWVHWDLTNDEFKAKDSTYFNQGLRLTQFEIEDGKLAGVWRPGSGTQWVKWAMTVGELEAQDRTYFNQGLRMTGLTVDGNLYGAVWQPGNGTQWWAARRCKVDFTTEDANHVARGLRMGWIEIDPNAASPWNYPWASGISFGVGQGNNNPGGSHNGVQAFAFDFSLPSNTEVRAARAGTVEWLQENQTTAFNPNAPVSPTNQPFPNGSLQNWGNAVRIRHDGGLTSWYFHLATNGVSVNVGDKVTQGQMIARSDNTGRTTSPHLHFQVQADSNNWGQSVPLSFRNCLVPTGGDTATAG